VQAPVGGTNQDEEHLKLIAVFHFVVAGLEAVLGLLPVIHVAMGIAMLTGYWPTPTSPSSGPMPDFMGWMFTIMGGAFILFYETLAFFTLLAGLSIRKRRRWLFCLVVAGVGCLNMPIGTTLGVFTFLVLLRPSVKALFEADPVAD
jgi:hypothetical protein